MDRHIKDILGNYLKDSKIGSGYTSEKIQTIWVNKMGSTVAKQTNSIRFYKGELKIKIISSVLKYELFQNTERVKEVLNKELGDEIIETIKFL